MAIPNVLKSAALAPTSRSSGNLLKGLLLACLIASSIPAGEFPSIPKEMLKATHRLSALKRAIKEDDHGFSTWGSAVAVNLSRFGLKEPRYLLTAAHCVVDDAGKKKHVTIEVTTPDGKDWFEAEILIYDAKADVALIKCKYDLPVLVELAELDEIDIGDPVIAIGCPKGTPPTGSLGFLAEKRAAIQKDETRPKDHWWQASTPIFHGNSGGPVFDANRKKLVGIATAIYYDDKLQAVIPNLGLFVPATFINDFITSNMKKLKKKEE